MAIQGTKCRGRLWVLYTAVLLSALPGCAKAPAPALDQAREAVQAALDAWQKGEKPETLQRRTPPIEFVDSEWRAGQRLLSYELVRTYTEGDDRPRCAVILQLQDRKGRTRQREVVYLVVFGEQGIVIGSDPYS